MHYIVALGNPGLEYEQTRHNVGFLALDFVIDNLNFPAAVNSAKVAGRITEGMIGKEEVKFLWPETFMNHSGTAVKKMVPTSEAANLIVLYDDVALPFGQVKISFGRGDGGHNGIKSITVGLDTKDFIRLRIGIAPTSFWTGKVKTPKEKALTRFVLSKFTKSELTKLNAEVFPNVEKTLVEIIENGYLKAMNLHN